MNKPKAVAAGVCILVFVEGIALLYSAARCQKASRKLKNIMPGYEKIEREAAALKDKYQGLEDKYDGQVKDSEELTLENRALAKENVDLAAQNEALKTDRSNLIAQAKALLTETGQAKQLAEKTERLKAEKDVLLKKMAGLKQQQAQLHGEVNRVNVKQAQMAKERDHYKTAYEKIAGTDVAKKLQEEVSYLNGLKAQMEGAGKQDAKAINLLSEKNSELVLKNDRLNRELKMSRDECVEALEDNKALRRQLKDAPRKFTELVRQNTALLKDTALAHYNMGVFYVKNKEYGRAITEFEKSIQINPDDAYAHFNLGRVYAEYSVNRPKAIEHFKKYLKLCAVDDKDTDYVKKYIIMWQTWEGKQPL